jgi:hypothetical protein
MGSVPFIIQVDSTFNGDETADLDINVKVASKEFKCASQKIAESDAQVTFPTVDQDGDCLGDGIRSDGKDPSKYIIVKNGDGSLTYKSDGYPDLKMTKQALAVAESLSGHYQGSVPFIIQVDSTFNGDSTADLDINVKVASKEFKCPGQKIAESDAQVTFPTVDQDGDCLGDGIRSDGKDPSKYIIVKNSDGSLTYKSDGYPDLKMTKQAIMV